jgi:hypothetical protein
MHTVVEIGDWEHECCGPAYQRDSVIELTCLVVPRADGTARYVETHHGLTSRHPTITLRGRVADIAIRHLDGSIEPLERLPGGSALRGLDAADDGHLARPWTDVPVINDSDDFRITISG